MTVCPSCQAANPVGSRFCSSCGSSLPGDADPGAPNPDADATIPTPISDRDAAATIPSVSPVATGSGGVVRPPSASTPRSGVPAVSSEPDADGGYGPGTLIADRYRILGLLGKGGMGEVYRADDLTLGQSVALKFLPATFSRSPERRARFNNEVRTAREVAHPNVCRVYDIGEVDGRAYLSMEYIDGEDLSSLLRRIGRLPEEKSLEIARQLCAGLGALHERGVLHRDLKPANVMLDGRGRVRITDFGLSGIAQEITGKEARAGTPAYMAPEQLSGERADERSDIYALGLVLYEVFTGRRAFEADSVAELSRLQETTPTDVSSILPDIDPAIERVIQRCLEKDASRRPPSAFAVAAALPGGDALAAALAAGEVPSVEMVAAAGTAGRVRPAVGLVCVAAVLIGLAIYATIGVRHRVYHWAPLEKPPQVLADRAREIADATGWTYDTDENWGFIHIRSVTRWIAKEDSSLTRWERLRDRPPDAVRFWYRRSPKQMVPWNPDNLRNVNDPPFTEPGMVRLWLDTSGHLIGFAAIPPRMPLSDSTQVDTTRTVDWDTLIRAAGFSPDSLRDVTPEREPRSYADERVAWVGTLPGHPDVDMRIEGAANAGRPISFAVLGPWSSRTTTIGDDEGGGAEFALEMFLVVLAMGILGCGVVLAVRNVKMGRGDSAGARRLSLGVLVAALVIWALRSNHPSRPTEFLNGFFSFIGEALIVSALFWVAYLAVEPYLRRTWPDSIVGWSRLLTGKFRDPLVGRDILIGGVFFLANMLLDGGSLLLGDALGYPQGAPTLNDDEAFFGPSGMVAVLVSGLINATFNSMFFMLLLLFLQLVVRKLTIAKILFVALFAVFTGLDSGVDGRFVAIAFGGITGVLWLVMLLRFGLLAFMVGFLFEQIAQGFPLVLGGSHWYSGASAFGMIAIVGITGYGLWLALAGESLFQDELFSEKS